MYPLRLAGRSCCWYAVFASSRFTYWYCELGSQVTLMVVDVCAKIIFAIFSGSKRQHIFYTKGEQNIIRLLVVFTQIIRTLIMLLTCPEGYCFFLTDDATHHTGQRHCVLCAWGKVIKVCESGCISETKVI